MFQGDTRSSSGVFSDAFLEARSAILRAMNQLTECIASDELTTMFDLARTLSSLGVFSEIFLETCSAIERAMLMASLLPAWIGMDRRFPTSLLCWTRRSIINQKL
jgi:hypothetical protein